MTVCVAAICHPGIVIAASDRMLTAGDIQFEPDRSKIVPITTSIFAMTAGDASIQDALLAKVRAEVTERIDETPPRWLTVVEIAELHAEYYAEEKVRRAEKKILKPLGLTYSSFLLNQSTMTADLVDSLSTELLNFEIEDISTIFAGIDEHGAHIYVVENEQINCHDSVGFVSIGVGQWHASSQLMFRGQSKSKLVPETMLNVYTAKKRAEVAPGVGRGTDMYSVHDLGRSSPFSNEELQQLESFWQYIRDEELKTLSEARNQCEAYVQSIIAAASAQQQALPEDQGPNPSADSKEGESRDKGKSESA